MTHGDLAWLAGLLEGEGCFYGNRRRTGYITCGLHLTMSDRDVVQRAAVMMHGKVAVRSKGEHKPAYEVALNGVRARTVMEDVLPFMGERRARKIQEVLAMPHWGFPESVAEARKRSTITARARRASRFPPK